MIRASFVGCFVIVLLGLIGGLFYLSAQIPDVAEQMPPNASSIVVTLMTPSNDSAVPLNDPTTIAVEAIGPQPIVAVELWADGTRMFAKKSDLGLKQFTATWSWLPPSEGTHTLIARARDVQQREGQSNIVRVVASKDTNPTTQIAYKTRPGDTIPVIGKIQSSAPTSDRREPASQSQSTDSHRTRCVGADTRFLGTGSGRR